MKLEPTHPAAITTESRDSTDTEHAMNLKEIRSSVRERYGRSPEITLNLMIRHLEFLCCHILPRFAYHQIDGATFCLSNAHAKKHAELNELKALLEERLMKEQ